MNYQIYRLAQKYVGSHFIDVKISKAVTTFLSLASFKYMLVL
jgi:hypothetical protein